MTTYYDADGNEIQEHKLEEQYEKMLDENHGTVRLGELEYAASRVLREVDPTAYRVGFADWLSELEENGQMFENDPTAEVE
ncbi:hypothetical protein EF847_01540 [Actinobacteria bacterium YIM 96077]|uniref:Uncharacterized protein n=1 Tax=Phytoactinopolyspora halophila TaxID=1981511 RepID=A0A329QFS0_9ACTN|nr:hypothetical protein [Phytoactinopolyspora halophila]AYY11604.1 hypothetical protein EF847_01540 [Actinobacteria bacterium YIM 96077]RAW11150.1 hypothetical protein DPM12_17565 [Phytoactinopolyspora halophila]